MFGKINFHLPCSVKFRKSHFVALHGNFQETVDVVEAGYEISLLTSNDFQVDKILATRIDPNFQNNNCNLMVSKHFVTNGFSAMASQ